MIYSSFCAAHSDMDPRSAEKIKEYLGTTTLEPTGFKAAGCINQGQAYKTDSQTVFIKRNKSPHVVKLSNAYHFISKFVLICISLLLLIRRQKSCSNLASLKALEITKTVSVPNPVGVVRI